MFDSLPRPPRHNRSWFAAFGLLALLAVAVYFLVPELPASAGTSPVSHPAAMPTGDGGCTLPPFNPTKESTETMSLSAKPLDLPLPAIDRDRPAHTETATFALG